VPVRTLPDTRGFSLLDALIAAAVLASALLSLAQVIAFAIKTTAAAGRMTDGHCWCRRKLRNCVRLRGASFSPAPIRPAAGFTRVWTITPLAADPDNVAVLEVLVRAPGGQTRMVALKTKPPQP
jgi:hypothetical protein